MVYLKQPGFEPGGQNARKIDHRWLPLALESSSQVIAWISNDMQYNHSKHLFLHRDRMNNCNGKDSFLFYIPWFTPF
ncbi:MAG: hypothetical protein OMM_08094 [Candidatus Magnetoglobus multicellularis str. Araruama]|uniref:Uncharacterized protein n=1 Tax=Candidatus Magnetoglobus multicellularis str. Araruama TaxID=890399 RepID=A0A1V1P9I3_9BACT|nr:MAG: hypothetical protein OMM_08094 [Candidatus Magnetoglobus multicellularis str. Araruama]